MIKDSGRRKEFSSGAVRDVQEGKGRFDLMPIDVLADLFPEQDLKHGMVCIHIALKEKDVEKVEYSIRAAVIHLSKFLFGNIYSTALEVSIHFEEGMNKYGKHNWRKGIPVSSFIDSAIRHLMKHLGGHVDERHDRACIWNLLCASWTLKNFPDLDDLDHDGYCGKK